MKEQYLSPATIDKVVGNMAQELTSRYYRPKPFKLIPERSALLVLDMQNYFLDPASHAFTPSAHAIVPKINKLIDLALQYDMEIILTKHVNDDENAGMMGKWWRDLCCETTARSAFVTGFEVFFPVDATAAYNREFHLSTFRNLGFGFCPILKTADLIHSLNEPE